MLQRANHRFATCVAGRRADLHTRRAAVVKGQVGNRKVPKLRIWPTRADTTWVCVSVIERKRERERERASPPIHVYPSVCV